MHMYGSYSRVILYASLILAIITVSVYAAPSHSRVLPLRYSMMPANWYSVHDHDMDLVEDALEAAGGRVKAYVILSSPAMGLHEEILRRYGAEIIYRFRYVLNGYLVWIDAERLESLAATLRLLDADHDGYADLLYIAQPKTYKPFMSWAAREGHARPIVWDLGYTGKGVRVAVLDTGIDLSTRGFNNSRVEFHDLVNGQANPYDEVGHGTMVSYVIAGNVTPSSDYGESGNEILTSFISYVNPVQTTQYFYVAGPLMVTGDASSLDITGYVAMYNYSSSGFVESAYLAYYPGYTVRDFNDYGNYWQLTVSYSQLSNGYYIATLSLPSPISNPPKGLYYIWVKFTVTGYIAEIAGIGRIPLIDDDTYWLDAGVAPEAGLVVFKVGDNNGIDTSLAVQALDTIAGWNDDNDPGNDVNIASMSFGGPSDDAAFHQAIRNAVDYGVLSVVAAGNDGPGSNNAGTTYPAAYPEVLTVAAVNTVGNITSYSSQGGTSSSDSTTVKPDIAAPGGSYYGPMAMKDSEGDGEIVFQTGDSYEVDHGDLQTAMGTSFATPFVSGVAALVVQAMKDYGLWANDKTHVLILKSILMATAVETYPMMREENHGYSPTLDRGTKDVHEGIGMVDAAAAISLVQSMANFYFGEKAGFINETMYAGGGPLYNVSSVYDIRPEQVFAQAAWGYYKVFRVYNVTINGSSYVTKYKARLVMDSSDPDNTDYDVYIYSVSTYNGDPLLDWSAASGKGVLDDSVTFTPEDGVIYYIVVKRAGFDVAPATLNLLVGPVASTWYDSYTHTVYVDAAAASPTSVAQYAHIVIMGEGGSPVFHYYYPTKPRGNGAGISATIQLPYGIPGGNYTVYVFFTSNATLSPSTVVEGPIAYNVTVPPPITITYSYKSPIKDTEPLVITGNVTYLNGTPVSYAEIDLYYSNGTLAETGYTGPKGDYVISHDIGVAGNYTFYLYVPGSEYYQAARSGRFNVTVLLTTNLTVSVTNTTPRAYQVFYVTGVLTDRYGNPLAGQSVTIQYSEDGSTWIDAGSATTNSSGVYSLPVYVIESGNYSIRAWFPGNTSAYLAESYSGMVNVSAWPASTRLNMTVTPTTVYAGEQVTVTVTLEALKLGEWKPIDGNVTIYRYSGGLWEPLANVTVVNGTGSTTVTMDYSGNIQLRAYYPGNATYGSAEAIETVNVLARPVTLTSDMPSSVNVGENYTVTVSLRDNLTGDPVPDAAIDVYVNGTYYWTLLTGPNGTDSFILNLGRPGIANVTLYYHSDGRYDSATAEYSVDARYPVSVSITYSPDKPAVDAAFNVTVAVTANGSGAAGILVRLYYLNGSQWVYLGGVTTNSSGYALFQVTMDEPGNYTFRADAEATWWTWSGSGETSIPVKYTTTVTVLSRNVTQYNDGTVYIVYRVLLTTGSGDPVPGATINLYKNTTLLATNTTDSSGVAVLKAWVSNTTALGTYTIEHPGSATTWSSQTTDTISVLPEPVPETGLVLIMLVAATMLAALLLLLRTRRK